jgi:uncharacterized protein (TIGR02118 family)
MIKPMELIKRKPGISRDEFIRHYEEVHAPLALKCFPTFSRYVRNYAITLPGPEEPDLNCITEIWFDDIEGAMTVIDALGGYKDDAVSGYTTEIGRVFHEDEEKFMDRGSRVSLLVEEKISK